MLTASSIHFFINCFGAFIQFFSGVAEVNYYCNFQPENQYIFEHFGESIGTAVAANIKVYLKKGVCSGFFIFSCARMMRTACAQWFLVTRTNLYVTCTSRLHPAVGDVCYPERRNARFVNLTKQL
jgi:hypothetical protein